jgi:hypothetical protein
LLQAAGTLATATADRQYPDAAEAMTGCLGRVLYEGGTLFHV